jgi:hypothetical protein
MRTVQLIQFTEEYSFDYGFDPVIHKLYPVKYLNDSYEIEYYDDYNDEYTSREVESISIFHTQNPARSSHIVHDEQELDFNLITIILEDDCELFPYRR